MQPKYSNAIKIGFIGGLAFTIVLGLLDVAHIVNSMQIVLTHDYLPDVTAVLYGLGYLLYIPFGLIFLITGYLSIRKVKPGIGYFGDIVTISALSGFAAGLFGALAYNVLWVVRPIVETAVVILIMKNGFDSGMYWRTLMDNDVVGFADPWVAGFTVVVNLVAVTPLILISGVVLAVAGGFVAAAIVRITAK